MKILPLTLLACTKAQYGNYGSRMSAAEIYSNQQVHQGNLCGEITHYIIGAQPQILKSPYYPASFSPQTQCHWTIRTQDPTARIKFTFVDWQMPTSGDGCMAAYFQIQDGTGLDEGTGESGSSAAVKLCGKNPGFVVTHENKATVVLHADEAGAAAVQRFKISISKTYDRPRMLDYDGHAVTDGRPSYAKNAPAVLARAPVGSGRPGLAMGAVPPRRPGPVSGSAGPTRFGGPPPAQFHGPTYGNAHGLGPASNGYTGIHEPGEREFENDEIEIESKEISKVALVFIYLAVIIILILMALFIRTKVQKQKEEREKEKEGTAANEK